MSFLCVFFPFWRASANRFSCLCVCFCFFYVCTVCCSTHEREDLRNVSAVNCQVVHRVNATALFSRFFASRLARRRHRKKMTLCSPWCVLTCGCFSLLTFALPMTCVLLFPFIFVISVTAPSCSLTPRLHLFVFSFSLWCYGCVYEGSYRLALSFYLCGVLCSLPFARPFLPSVRFVLMCCSHMGCFSFSCSNQTSPLPPPFLQILAAFYPASTHTHRCQTRQLLRSVHQTTETREEVKGTRSPGKITSSVFPRFLSSVRIVSSLPHHGLRFSYVLFCFFSLLCVVAVFVAHRLLNCLLLAPSPLPRPSIPPCPKTSVLLLSTKCTATAFFLFSTVLRVDAGACERCSLVFSP